MKYMYLLFHAESPELGSPEQMAAWGAFEAYLAERGGKLSGEALQPSATATVVSVRGGETMTTDGPFAETKEQIGGYYVIDCANLDEAIEIATKIPWAPTGYIEVRPIIEF